MSPRSSVSAFLLLLLCAACRSEDLVRNGGFELPVDGAATEIADWSRWQATSETAYRVPEPVAEGQWALHIRSDPRGGSQVVQQPLDTYEPRRRYEVVFQGRSVRDGDIIRSDVIDRAPGAATVTLGSNSFANDATGWNTYITRFSAPDEPGHPLLVRFFPGESRADCAVLIDDVHIRPVSQAAVALEETGTAAELGTFNATVKLEYDLGTQLSLAEWRTHDLREHNVIEPGDAERLIERVNDLRKRLAREVDRLEHLRQQNLPVDTVLSALSDRQIADSAAKTEAFPAQFAAAVAEVADHLGPQVSELASDIDRLTGDWQPPAQRTADYSPRMLSQRFHRIISYHGYMPASEYLHHALWNLQPTAVQGYLQRPHRIETRREFLRLNRPRVIPYIESVPAQGFPFDLTQVKAGIDEVLADIGDDPSFVGIQMDEPSITDKHVYTPEGYAAFEEWLRDKYAGADDVGGIPLGQLLAWEAPAQLETDLDSVAWMEMQQFKREFFARQLRAVQDYAYEKRPGTVFLVVIQQYLPTQPQHCSYVTTAAALDWISMDPYNSGNVAEAFQMDLLRSNSKGPNMLVVGTCYDRSVDRFAKDMSISFAHCGGVYDWCWVYMSPHRAPAGVTQGAWPVKYRNYWKAGMYEAALEVMGEMATIEPYLVNTTPGAHVAIVYSERTGIWESRPDVPDTYYANNMGWYQALQQSHIPCDVIFAEAMTPERLAAFNTLIVSDAALLTAGECSLLVDWCEAGGHLMLTGSTGTRDEWGRPVTDFGGLTEMLGLKRNGTKSGASAWGPDAGHRIQYDAAWPYEVVGAVDGRAPDARFDDGAPEPQASAPAKFTREWGKGRVTYHCGHLLGHSFDGSKAIKALYRQYWDGFLDYIKAETLPGAPDQPSLPPAVFSSAEPDNVEVAVRRQGERLIVHLLNYDDIGPVTGMELSIPGRAGQRAFYPVDGSDAQTEEWARDRGMTITVRDFNHHCCIVIEPRQ